MKDNKQKAFVILTPGFAASENDSTCLPMQQKLVKTISDLYVDSKVVVLSFQYPYCKKSYQWFSATVYSFNGKNRGGVARLLLKRRVREVLMKIKEEYEIIGLLSFWLNECAVVGKSFGERFFIPHYCWILGQDARAESKYPKRLAVQSKELVALSDFLQEEFERNYGIRPFKVIPAGIEIESFTEQTRDVDLLAVGSLIPLKQFEIFIEIVAEVKKKFDKVKALIIGDGAEKRKLEKLILALGLSENISIAGELQHDEVLKTMQRSRILVHPSSYEGFSGVCLEALSSGAHVVSFCRAMNKEIAHWHIVNDKAEMIQMVLNLLRKKIDHNQVTPFSIKDTACQLMNLYCQNSLEQFRFSMNTTSQLLYEK